MLVHIQRDGQQFGPYTLEDLNAHLASGALLPTDYAWYEGAANWMAMRDVPGVVLPGAPLATTVTATGEAPKKKTALYVGIGAAVLAVAGGGAALALKGGGDELGEAGAGLKSEVKGDSSGSAKGGSVFARDVVPILRKHKCFNCHSAKESNKVEADLDFSVPSTMRAFLSPNQPGNPATTPLVLAVTAAPGEGRPMPPTGPRMSDAEVDVIKAWIAAGAKY
jgi:hypothetical protein